MFIFIIIHDHHHTIEAPTVIVTTNSSSSWITKASSLIKGSWPCRKEVSQSPLAVGGSGNVSKTHGLTAFSGRLHGR